LAAALGGSDMHQDSVWKLAFGVVILLAFAAIGVGCVISPEWGIRYFGRTFRRGGDLQREWNHIAISLAGLAFAGFAFYVLFELLRDYIAHR